MSIRNSDVSKKNESGPATSSRASSRRRGIELEDSLLEAAWSVLREAGYQGFSIEIVAERARTSRTVLYRRWPDRAALALAAIKRRSIERSAAVPDTGSLSGDLRAYLADLVGKRAEIMALLSLRMEEYFAETRFSIGEMQEKLLEGRPAEIEEIYARAVARGELNPARLTPRIARLPLSLIGYDWLFTGKPATKKSIAEIVDTIFIPLVVGSAPRRMT
jgi:AcrR family transcriptional regulator